MGNLHNGNVHQPPGSVTGTPPPHTHTHTITWFPMPICPGSQVDRRDGRGACVPRAGLPVCAGSGRVRAPRPQQLRQFLRPDAAECKRQRPVPRRGLKSAPAAGLSQCACPSREQHDFLIFHSLLNLFYGFSLTLHHMPGSSFIHRRSGFYGIDALHHGLHHGLSRLALLLVHPFLMCSAPLLI